MKQETQALVSLIVSCLAFLVSGGTFGWTMYRDVLDKGRLRITLMVGRFIPGIGGAAPVILASDLFAEKVAAGEANSRDGSDQLVVTITNVGKRSIVATKIAGRQRVRGKRHFVMGNRVLPKTLQPGEFVTDMIDNPIVLADPVRSIFVCDSLDRMWKVSRRNFKRTKADAKRFPIGGGR